MSSNYSLGGVGGFNSGLDVNSIISQLLALEQRPIQLIEQKKATVSKQQTAYTSIQTKTRDFLSAMQTMSKRELLTSKTIFDNMKATSSDKTLLSASVTNSATPQTLNVEVVKLPSATKATSTGSISALDGSTTLSSLGIQDGAFTLYINSQSFSVPVLEINTLDELQTSINTALAGASPAVPNLEFSFNDGQLGLSTNPLGTGAETATIGFGNDTSNFLSKTFLNTGQYDVASKKLLGSQPISTLNRNVDLTTAAANVAGSASFNSGSKFTINGQEFTVGNKTLNALLEEINSNADANVTASYNKGTDSLELVSKATGSSFVDIKDTVGNFLQAMKLVNGSDTTTSQTVGSNTEFKLNGQTMYATDSTVDETITGLTGVTLNLKKVAVGTTAQITIQKDTDAIVKQVKTVMDKYNLLMEEIDKQTKIDPEATKTGATANNGPLANENSLKSFRTQLRSMFTQSIGVQLGTGSLDSLQMIGISSSKTDVSAVTEEDTSSSDDEEEDTSTATAKPASTAVKGQLYFNESKFRAALQKDPDAVRKLMIGIDLPPAASGIDDALDGTFTKIERLITDKTYTTGTGKTGFGALYSLGSGSKGLFASYQEASGKRIQALTESIKRANDRLVIKEKTLRQQYLAMDKLVGQYQKQGSALASLQTQNYNN